MDLHADVNQYLDWQAVHPFDEPIRVRSLTEINNEEEGHKA